MYKIGNVCLDETYYPGEDLYSDGAVEERLLELAEEYGAAYLFSDFKKKNG